MAFPHAQTPTFVNCSFSEHNGNINTYQNLTTGPPSGENLSRSTTEGSAYYSSAALQILWNAISPGATYNSEERYPQPKCLPHTRVETIKNIERWADKGTPILWLHGPAGAGKSAVAQTMCEKWAKAGFLLASFFISRTAPTRNTIDRFIITIAYQAMLALAGRLDHILSIIESDPHILRQDLNVQLKTLLINPLKEFLKNAPKSPNRKAPSIIVIDAVDECSGDENQLRLLSLILSLLDPEHALPIRFLIVSRPESHLTHTFNNRLKSVSSIESLYGARKDVYKYLEVEFARIHDSEKHSEMMVHVAKPWPGSNILHELTKRSGGYFIYAATVVRHVDEEGYFCIDRLKEILDRDSRAPGCHPYRELDKVYSQVLSKARNIHTVKRILGCLITAKSALFSLFDNGLARFIRGSSLVNTLFSLRPGELKMALRGLQSIVLLSDGGMMFDIDFYHASFSDYLLDQERSGEYHINRGAVMQDVCLSSLRLLGNPTRLATPSRDWFTAITCWTRIGCSQELLLEHVRENASFFPSLIQSSKCWDKDAQLRLLSQFCTMIAILRDCESAKDAEIILSGVCQSAFAMYWQHDDNADAWKSIQDIRTLNEASPSRYESVEVVLAEVAKFKIALRLSPAEKSCVDHFMYIWHQIQLFGHSDILRVKTETGTWKSSLEILKENFQYFLDNEKYWGGTHWQEARKSRVRMRLASSAVGRELLRKIDPWAYSHWRTSQQLLELYYNDTIPHLKPRAWWDREYNTVFNCRYYKRRIRWHV